MIVRTKQLLGPIKSVDSELTALTEAFVCTQCGFFEEYVTAPGEIPWEDVEGATVIADS